jgi:hypothetical protein
LVAAIQARTQRQTALVDDGTTTPRFRVELLERGPSTLWVDLPEGSSQRDLPAQPCANAVAAVAVIAAMVLDSELGPKTTGAQAEPAVDESLALPPSRPEPAAPAPAPAALPPAGVSVADRHLSGPASETGSRLDVVAGITWEGAVAPTPPLGGTGGLELRSRGRGWWAPRLRAELMATASSVETLAAGDATFRLLTGRLSACAVQLPLARAARLVPCASFDAGSLSAEGSGSADNVATKRMPWLALGVMTRLEVDLARWASLEGFTALRRLARHDRFVFRPETLVYDLPAWSPGMGVGLSLHFD